MRWLSSLQISCCRRLPMKMIINTSLPTLLSLKSCPLAPLRTTMVIHLSLPPSLSVCPSYVGYERTEIQRRRDRQCCCIPRFGIKWSGGTISSIWISSIYIYILIHLIASSHRPTFPLSAFYYSQLKRLSVSLVSFRVFS